MDWLFDSGLVGAVYGLVGSAYLAKGLAFAGDKSVYNQAKVPFDFNPTLLRDLCEQRFDTRLGLVLLIAAMAWQVVGYLILPEIPVWAIAMLLIPMVFLSIRRYRATPFDTAVDVATVMILNNDEPGNLRNGIYQGLPAGQWDHVLRKAAKRATKGPVYRAFL